MAKKQPLKTILPGNDAINRPVPSPAPRAYPFVDEHVAQVERDRQAATKRAKKLADGPEIP